MRCLLLGLVFMAGSIQANEVCSIETGKSVLGHWFSALHEIP